MSYSTKLRREKVASDVFLPASALLVSIMVIIRDLSFGAVSPYLFLGIIAIISLVLPYKYLVAFFFFDIPFSTALHGITVYPIILALLLKSKRPNFFQVIFTVLILAVEMIHLTGYDLDVDYVKFFVYAPNVLLFFYILFDDTLNDQDVYNGIKYYSIGVVAVALAVILHSIQQFGVAGVLLGDMRIGGDLDFENTAEQQFTVMNANTLAFFVVTAFSLLLFVGESVKNKVFKAILFILLFLAGALTTSRTWIIVTAAVVLVFFFTSKQRGRYGLIIITLILFIFAVRYANYADNLTGRFTKRFQEDNVESGGLRTELFEAYDGFMRNNPDRVAFGTGVIYYKEVTNIWNSVHSGFQQIYVCYGVFGILLYLLCFIIYLRRYQRGKKFLLVNYMPFMACAVFDQSIQFLNPFYLMLPFVVSLLPLKLSQQQLQSIKQQPKSGVQI